ncbi:MAG: M20 family metallopeptidase [Verrucomicrobiota bacterium]|nr:M20 family metallopeptidase [Verrucomicrobiota bacterium]
MKNPSSVESFLRDLIAIPSVNPHGDPGVSAEKTGEGNAARFIGDFFKAMGLDVEFQEVYPGRPNVIGRTKGGANKPKLLLIPHTDTVSVLGMTIDPFDPVVRNGRIYGRGACDDKGPLSAMAFALKNVLEKRAHELKYEVIFAAVMGEEAGNEGVRHLVKKKIKADFCIAGEPTDLNPVNTHKGAMWAVLTAGGKAVHSSQPHKGDNAIYKMARAITYLEQVYFPALQKRKNKELGAPTLSVGIVSGGSKVNIVPDVARAEVDFRTTPEQDQGQIIMEILAAFKKLKIDVQVEQSRGCEPLYTDPKNPHLLKLANISKKMFGRGKTYGAPWFCDAAIAAGGGIPAIAWGPGSIGQAHTKDEYIETAELVKGREIFEEFLTR